jgi:hypothetical protein
MTTKSLGQSGKISPGRVMAHGVACSLPHMLLRVQLRAAGREMQRFHVRALSEIIAHHFAFVSPGPIPQDQQRPPRIGRLHMIQKNDRSSRPIARIGHPIPPLNHDLHVTHGPEAALLNAHVWRKHLVGRALLQLLG